MGFRTLLSLGVAFAHLYLWLRLVHDTKLRRAHAYLASAVLLVLWASIPATFFYLRRTSELGDLAHLVAFVWLGLMFYAFVLLLGWDGVRTLRWLYTRASRAWTARVPRFAPAPEPTPAMAPAVEPATEVASVPALAHEELQTRRVFVARAAATSALVATGGIGVFGVRAALWDITMPELEVKLARLPRALDGFTIAHLSDVHIGPTLDARFLRDVVEQVNRMRPDLIAITGDLVDGTVGGIGAEIALLQKLRARSGVYFVTGNHEYYSGATQWMAFLRRLGIRVLMNEHVAIGDAAANGAQFDLAGVPDHRAGGPGELAPSARAATEGRDPERELIVLAHQPVQIADVAPTGAGLQLSGHTHGGQLYPFGALTLLAQPYLAGLYHHAPSATQVYVSRGTGFWGPPMRVLAPAEIARIRLVSG
jgi:predicted MPP superfamily phosphohydrolase